MTGKFDPTFMISHRVPIDDFTELYDKFDRRVGGIQKVFVETKFSNRTSLNSLLIAVGSPILTTSVHHDWSFATAAPAPGCPKTTRAKDI